jgi:hypothetical protein
MIMSAPGNGATPDDDAETLELALASKFARLFKYVFYQKDRYWAAFRQVNKQARASFELHVSCEAERNPEYEHGVSAGAVYALVAKKISGIKRDGTMPQSGDTALNCVADCWMMGKILTLTVNFIHDDRDLGNENRLEAAVDDGMTTWTDLSRLVDDFIDNEHSTPFGALLEYIEQGDPDALDEPWE